MVENASHIGLSISKKGFSLANSLRALSRLCFKVKSQGNWSTGSRTARSNATPFLEAKSFCYAGDARSGVDL